MGAPEITDERVPVVRMSEGSADVRLACTRLARKWPGGSPLRAAGGQPYWNARPDQTRPLQSLQRTHRSPEGLRFGLCCTNLRKASSGDALASAPTPLPAMSRAVLRLRSISVRYLISAFAPASSIFFLIASASALLMPSFSGFGAPSTRSFASLRPRLVTSRTALMVFTLFSPAAVSITVNSVFSSAGAAPAPPPAPGAATATVAAAAETPNFSSMSLMSCESSRTDMLPIASRRSCLAIAIDGAPVSDINECREGSGRGLLLLVADGGHGAHELRGHLVQRLHELGDRRLHRAHQPGEELLAAGHRGEASDFLRRHQVVRHHAALDDELFVALRVGVEHLRRGHGVVGDAVGERADHVVGELLERRPLHRAAREGVLQHAKVDAGGARLRAQHGDVLDGQAAVLGQDDGLCLGEPRGHFRHD